MDLRIARGILSGGTAATDSTHWEIWLCGLCFRADLQACSTLTGDTETLTVPGRTLEDCRACDETMYLAMLNDILRFAPENASGRHVHLQRYSPCTKHGLLNLRDLFCTAKTLRPK